MQNSLASGVSGIVKAVHVKVSAFPFISVAIYQLTFPLLSAQTSLLVENIRVETAMVTLFKAFGNVKTWIFSLLFFKAPWRNVS